MRPLAPALSHGCPTMRIVFMGTPEFARAVLAHLCESNHNVVAVVTGRDRRSRRGGQFLPTAVRTEADKRGLPVLMPAKLADDVLFEQLRELAPDLFVVAAFKILPPRL